MVSDYFLGGLTQCTLNIVRDLFAFFVLIFDGNCEAPWNEILEFAVRRFTLPRIGDCLLGIAHRLTAELDWVHDVTRELVFLYETILAIPAAAVDGVLISKSCFYQNELRPMHNDDCAAVFESPCQWIGGNAQYESTEISCAQVTPKNSKYV